MTFTPTPEVAFAPPYAPVGVCEGYNMFWHQCKAVGCIPCVKALGWMYTTKHVFVIVFGT
jgi:hypothetical protein